MASTLELLLLYLVAAVAGVVLCRSRAAADARLPGGRRADRPAARWPWRGDSAGVSHLAEFGVVFLMFVIGLEFNLPKLRSMRKLVFGLGLSQVVLTILAALAGNALLAGPRARGKRGWGSAGRARSRSAARWR